MKRKYHNNNIIIASREYFLEEAVRVSEDDVQTNLSQGISDSLGRCCGRWCPRMIGW
jgi:hypothetical protein